VSGAPYRISAGAPAVQNWIAARQANAQKKADGNSRQLEVLSGLTGRRGQRDRNQETLKN